MDRPRWAAGVGAAIVTHEHWKLALGLQVQVAQYLDPALVLVVANTPSAAHALRASGITVLANSSPLGYGANLNRATRAMPELDVVLLLNDDVRLDAPDAERLVAALRTDPGCALAAPRIVDGEGVPQPSAFRFPRLSTMLRAQLVVPKALARWPDVLPVDAPSGVVDWVLGAVMAARSEALQEVDGFDEAFFLYAEETDLARRLHGAGWRVRFAADAVAVHLGSASTGGRADRLNGRARLRYARKHWRWPTVGALVVGAALVQVWNAGYTLVRVVLRPSSARAACVTWRSHWSARTLP